MVDLSLKKARNNWKNGRGHSLGRRNSKELSPQEPSDTLHVPKRKTNKSNKPADDKPIKVDAHGKNKAASSMQRRLSVYNNPNTIASKLDYTMPLPQFNQNDFNDSLNSSRSNNIDTTFAANDNSNPTLYNNLNASKHSLDFTNTINQFSGSNSNDTNYPSNNKNNNNNQTKINHRNKVPLSDIVKPNVLRSFLTDTNFNAKDFVHENLSNASAIDIDNFTTTLNDLSLNIKIEAKDNINRSYKEIMQVNSDLNIASTELKLLRDNIKELSDIIAKFNEIAIRRIAMEESQYDNINNNNGSLLPPVRDISTQSNSTSSSYKKRDKTSLTILDQIWKEELLSIEKETEGASKYLKEKGRHLIMKTDKWMELNVATLRYLQDVKLYILNDIILIADKNKNNDYILNQVIDIKEVSVTMDVGSKKRLIFTINNNTTLMYEAPNEKECSTVLQNIRKAKDEICDIYLNEKQYEQKLKETVKYFQSSQPTPTRDSLVGKSPSKSNRRSVGTPNRLNSLTMKNRHASSEMYNEQYLLQSLTLSMHSNLRNNTGRGSHTERLQILDDNIEEIDINIARYRFAKCVDIILNIENDLNELYPQLDDQNLMLHNILLLKINERRDLINTKLSQNILLNDDIAKLKLNVSGMVKLGSPDQGLDLFLQNRSNYIQELILQIGSFDNPTNYLTQLSVIRFQIIKQTVLNFNELLDQCSISQNNNNVNTNNLNNKFSSILVNWCSSEVDKHFLLINQQLLNDETISPQSIKSTRRQIDELKNVGLDFVYKLDEFIRVNSYRIG